MNASSQDSWFEIVSSIVILASFITMVLCIATLRFHIDEAKLRAEPSVSKIFASQIPPERVLTKVGRRRVFIAKVAILILVIGVTAVVVKTQILGLM